MCKLCTQMHWVKNDSVLVLLRFFCVWFKNDPVLVLFSYFYKLKIHVGQKWPGFGRTVELGYNEGLGKLDFVRYNRFSL